MSDTARFRRLYRQLGLSETAGIDDLRRRWRQLAGELHPDRHPEDPQAAERFHRARAAYETLRAHHAQHGRLPLGGRQAVIPPTASPGPAPTPPRRRRRLLPTAGLLGVLGMLGAAAWLQLPDTAPPAPLPPGPATPGTPSGLRHPAETPPAPSETRHILPGTTLGELIEIAGVPDRSDDRAWHYGPSVVWLRDGRVIGWRNTPDHPLPTDPSLPLDLEPADPPAGR